MAENIWMLFHCYFCQKRMFITKQSTTSNHRTGQKYIKTRYVCPHCDYWLVTEVPRALAATIVDEACLPPLEPEPQQRSEPAQASSSPT